MAGLSGFFFTDTSLAVGLAEADIEVVKQMEEVLLEVASRSLEYAKANAPWTDRTGNARNGLDVAVENDGNALIMELFHTVDYGLWLEVIQNGRFAIIMPTLQGYALEQLGSDQVIASVVGEGD
jgi:hypothetical protein